MKSILLSEDVIPIGEFKKQASSLVRRVKDLGRPILITQNGSPVSVVIPPEEYDRICEQARFVEAVKTGLRDSEAGNVFSGKDLEKELDRSFGSLKHAKKQ